MTFDKILGHNNIKNNLISSINNDKVSHAYIFSGKSGVGKTSMALAFANELTQNSFADVTVVTNEKYNIKTVAFSVEAIREARKEMFTRPYIADKKVFILPNADTMTISAQNALLMVLEEPPAFCVIILIAENENILLQTIRSRAISLKFAPLSDEIINTYLVQKYGEKNYTVFIRLASGSIKTADELVTKEGLNDTLAEFISLMKQISKPDIANIYKIISFMDGQKANINLLFDVMLIMFRDTLLNNNIKDDTIAIENIDNEAVILAIDLVEKSRKALSFNANFTIVISELLLKIWEAIYD